MKINLCPKKSSEPVNLKVKLVPPLPSRMKRRIIKTPSRISSSSTPSPNLSVVVVKAYWLVVVMKMEEE